MSEHAARFIAAQIETRNGIKTELIDISKLPMPIDDAGEGIKDPVFSERMTMADALVIVTPEYNHSFPGLLKHVLDSCLKEYIHKAAGIVGVSAGPFGGVRAIQDFLPVIREYLLGRQFRQCKQDLRRVRQAARRSLCCARR
jgi:NAD(P)H-dependent FMN reductase